MTTRNIEVDVMANYRTSKDDHMTDLTCSGCGCQTEQYIRIEGWIRVCKGCLSRWTNMLNEAYQEYMKKAIKQ